MLIITSLSKFPFDTNLHGLAGLQTVVHLLVEEMARTGDAHHIIAGIQTDEVGKLQGVIHITCSTGVSITV